MKTMPYLIVIMATLTISGCVTLNGSKDIHVIRSLNQRLMTVEKKLKVRGPAIEREQARRTNELNNAQKDLVKCILEYLEGRD